MPSIFASDTGQTIIKPPSDEELAFRNVIPQFGFVEAIPTATDPVTITRSLDGDHYMFRTLTSVLSGASGIYFDEYIFRKHDGTGSRLDNGLQLIEWRGVGNGKVRRWLIRPPTEGVESTADFAPRMGYIADTYTSSGDGPNWHFYGYGHNGDLRGTGHQILLNGGGSDLTVDANLAAGATVRGTSANMVSNYSFYMRDGVLGGTISQTNLFGTDGLRELGTIAPSGSGLGWNDGYFSMMPLSHYDVDWIKPSGVALDTESDLNTNNNSLSFDTVANPSGVQKGNWTTNTATEFQAYGDDDNTLIAELGLVYGPPIRNSDNSQSAWFLNTYGRAFFKAQPDYHKFYVFANSSAQDPGSRVAWDLDENHTWFNTRRTRYRASGPV